MATSEKGVGLRLPIARFVELCAIRPNTAAQLYRLCQPGSLAEKRVILLVRGRSA